MKKIKICLIVVTIVLFLILVTSVVLSKMNSGKVYRVDDYFRVEVKKESNDNEKYLHIKIINTSDHDLYDGDFVFGTKVNKPSQDNFIWFRILKIHKDDIVHIKYYQNSETFSVSSNKSTSNVATYNVSISPSGPDLDIDECMNLSRVRVDSDKPSVKLKSNAYLKTNHIILGIATLLGVGSLIVIKKKEIKNEKN